jgi:hypothetical protein
MTTGHATHAERVAAARAEFWHLVHKRRIALDHEDCVARALFWRSTRWAFIALLAAAIMALGVYSAQAESTLPVTAKPDIATLPTTEQLYHMQMIGMLVCPRMTKLTSRDALADELRQNYGELHERTVYITSDALAELYINRRSGSWSLVRTGPHKQACMISAGTRGFRPEEIPL